MIGLRYLRICDDMLSHFIPECDRRTDGQDCCISIPRRIKHNAIYLVGEGYNLSFKRVHLYSCWCWQTYCGTFEKQTEKQSCPELSVMYWRPLRVRRPLLEAGKRSDHSRKCQVLEETSRYVCTATLCRRRGDFVSMAARTSKPLLPFRRYVAASNVTI